MAITIQCADRTISIEHEEIQALTHLLLECFYTRHIIDQALAAPKAPFTIQSSYDDEEWSTRLQEGHHVPQRKSQTQKQYNNEKIPTQKHHHLHHRRHL